MRFVEMDPELAMKAIEGYANELGPEHKVQEAFYRQFPCPRCGGKTEKHFLSIAHSFSGDGLLPRFGLKCMLCDCIFDPHSSIIVDLGNAGKIGERIRPTLTPIIGNRNEE
jgi:hypothetical protein